MKELAIAGDKINSLEEFYSEFTKILPTGTFWGKNLDALNDVLSGGFGLPDQGFRLIWKNHEHSKESLGINYSIEELARWIPKRIPENRTYIEEEINKLKNGTGQTFFEKIIHIINSHKRNGVELVLD